MSSAYNSCALRALTLPSQASRWTWVRVRDRVRVRVSRRVRVSLRTRARAGAKIRAAVRDWMGRTRGKA